MLTLAIPQTRILAQCKKNVPECCDEHKSWSRFTPMACFGACRVEQWWSAHQLDQPCIDSLLYAWYTAPQLLSPVELMNNLLWHFKASALCARYRVNGRQVARLGTGRTWNVTSGDPWSSSYCCNPRWLLVGRQPCRLTAWCLVSRALHSIWQCMIWSAKKQTSIPTGQFVANVQMVRSC